MKGWRDNKTQGDSNSRGNKKGKTETGCKYRKREEEYQNKMGNTRTSIV